MEERDPFGILDIAADTDWRVVEAAYRMLALRVSEIADTQLQFDALADIEWAYTELKDPKRRLAYYRRHLKMKNDNVDKLRASGTDYSTETGTRRQTVFSMVLSGVLFVSMLSAIGYGLYLVGAVRPESEVAQLQGDISNEITQETATPTVKELGIEMDEKRHHTATVEALYATATRGALIDYTVGLTATMVAVRLALTPTPVQLRACPNVASVNVRTGAGTGYRAIGYVLEGDCVSVTGRHHEGEWLVIANAPRPSSDGGWVSASLMTIDGDIAGLWLVDSD